MTQTAVPTAAEAGTGLPHGALVLLTGPRPFDAEHHGPAVETLRTLGFEVRDPAQHVRAGMTDRVLLAADLDYATGDADAVATLPDWRTSPHARAVVAVAQASGLPILDALTGHPIEPTLTVHVGVGETEACQEPAQARPAWDTFLATDRADDADTPAREALRAAPVTAPAPAQPAPAASPSGGEIRMTSATGGQKGAKEARFSLIPQGPLWELAVLYGRGAEKYDPDNWKKGYDWSLSYDAMKRHLDLWWTRTEDHDLEMGVKHLICVIWHAVNLCWFMENRPEFDNRPNGIADQGEKYEGALPTPQWILDKRAQAAAGAEEAA